MPSSKDAIKSKAWKQHPVYFRPADNHRSLYQHFKKGTCERVAMGRLESLAAKNAQRCVFEGMDSFVKGCNANCRKWGTKEFHRATYERVLAAFATHGIITDLHAHDHSRRLRVLVDFEDGSQDWRTGWIVAPHDFLTHKVLTHGGNGACHFDGFGKSPDFPYSPSSGPKIWVPVYGPTAWRMEGLRWIKDAGATVDRCGAVAGDLRGRCGAVAGEDGGEDAGDDSFEPCVNTADNPSTVADLTAGSPAPVVTLVSKSVGNDCSEGSYENQGPATISSICLLTDKNQRPSASRDDDKSEESAAPATMKTIGQYFENASDVLRLMTDGKFDTTNSSLRTFKHMEELRSAATEAVRKHAETRLKDRKALAKLMRVTMDVLQERYPPVRRDPTLLFKPNPELYYPKAWLRIMHELDEGGPIQLSEPIRAVTHSTEQPSAAVQNRIAVWNAFQEAYDGHFSKLDKADAMEWFDERWDAFTKTDQYEKFDVRAGGDVAAALNWIEKESK